MTNGRRIEAGKKSGFSQDATVVSIDSNNTVEVVKPGQRSAWTTRAYTCSGAGNLPVQPVQSRSNSAFPAAVKVTAIGREQDSPSTSGRAVKGMALGLGPDSPGAPGRGRVDSVIVSLGPVAVAIARDAMNGQYDEVGSGVGVGSSGSVL